MSTTKTKHALAPVPSQPRTVDEFALIPEYGDNRMELIDGRIVRRDEIKPAQVGATECLRRQLEGMIPPNWFVREDKPVRIPEWTEPLPDIAVVRGNFRDTYPCDPHRQMSRPHGGSALAGQEVVDSDRWEFPAVDRQRDLLAGKVVLAQLVAGLCRP
jgi:hypothetical protein